MKFTIEEIPEDYYKIDEDTLWVGTEVDANPVLTVEILEEAFKILSERPVFPQFSQRVVSGYELNVIGGEKKYIPNKMYLMKIQHY
jgi:hypothetical protein